MPARSRLSLAAPKVAPKAPNRRAKLTVLPTLAQTVADRLRAALLEGRFAPDEKLNEASLSSMLEVSRTPVRSALHSLTADGLLDYVPNRGYSVRGVDRGRISSIFDVRGALEGLAARLAAMQGLDDAEQTSFTQALAAGDRILDKGRLLAADRVLFSDVNARIHAAILDATGNRMLQDMLRMCHNIPVSSERNVLWDDFRWVRRSHEDHHILFEAICSRDAARAERVMTEHIHSVQVRLMERL